MTDKSHPPAICGVSVIVPCRNTREFLPARWDSICRQTHADFEVIVIEGESTDGSLEFWEEAARQDGRVQVFRQTSTGLYAAWNEGLALAKGRYIYFATSDDTMAPDCLAKMVAALETHSECDICSCCLTTIDKDGREIAGAWEDAFITRYFGDLMKQTHVRLAPHDGILYGSERCVYSSITQLLLRRQLFDRVGGFRTDLGSEADWEWGMRAALVSNTIHIPFFLATWRIHPNQATKGGTRFSTGAWHRSVQRQISLATATAKRLQPARLRRLSGYRLAFCARLNALRAELKHEPNLLRRIRTTLANVILNPDVFLYWFLHKLRIRTFQPDWQEQWIAGEIRRITDKPLVVKID